VLLLYGSDIVIRECYFDWFWLLFKINFISHNGRAVLYDPLRICRIFWKCLWLLNLKYRTFYKFGCGRKKAFNALALYSFPSADNPATLLRRAGMQLRLQFVRLGL